MNGGLQLHLAKHLLYTSFLGLCTHLVFNILRQDVVNAQTLYETKYMKMGSIIKKKHFVTIE